MADLSESGQAGALNAALVEAAVFLENAIGEAVPLPDYLASVAVFASVLECDDLIEAVDLS